MPSDIYDTVFHRISEFVSANGGDTTYQQNGDNVSIVSRFTGAPDISFANSLFDTVKQIAPNAYTRLTLSPDRNDRSKLFIQIVANFRG